MARIRQVREHDGTLSPYRERKVTEAIHQALRESGSDDRGLAEELAGVVSLFLERTHPEAEEPPRVSEIADTIERVLRETGNESAARRFERVRKVREQLRDQITVRTTPRRGVDDVRLAAEVGGDVEISKWSRSRLVRSLTEAAELPAPMAEEVAAAIEGKIFGLDLKSVSADLIRHLVECELFERGIQTGDRAGERVPISSRSLTADLFEDAAGESKSPVESVAGPVLAHFALTELHGAAVATAHAEGLLHVHGLENPLAIERLALPWDLIVAGPGRTDRSLFDLRRTLDAIRPHVAGVIELPDVLPRLLFSAADPAGAIDDLLAAVTAIDVRGRPVGPAVEISVPLSGAAGSDELRALEIAVRRLGERLVDEDSGAVRIRFVDSGGGEPLSAEALELAFGVLRASPFASIEIDRPGPPRHGSGVPDLRISLARVTLNLPLLLMTAAGDGLKEALAGLDRGARLALDAFQERAWVQRKGGPSGLPGIAAFLGGAGRVAVPASGQEVDLEVWGLSHAIELLVRRGLVARPAVPEAAARLLAHIHYHLGEERDGMQLLVRTGGTTSRAVKRRLLAACEANARRLGVADLAAELKNERTAEGVLPLAIPLGDRRNKPLLTSRVVERLGPGLGIPEACIAGGLSRGALSDLRESSKLGTLRLSPPGVGGLFEIQEELFG